MKPLNMSEWQALDRHYSDLKHISMREEFALDSKRFNRFSVSSGELLLDYSKNLITKDTMTKLVDLAESVAMKDWIDRLFLVQR